MYQTRQLLRLLAIRHQKERLITSSDEIAQKIQHIRYLAKAPFISSDLLEQHLKKLEENLEAHYTLETQLRKERYRTAITITAQKKQIDKLKEKISLLQDTEVTKKVNKLSHLVSEAMAHKHTQQQVLQTTQKKQPLSKQQLLDTINQLNEKLHDVPLTTENQEKIKRLTAQIEKLQRQLEPPQEIKHTVLLPPSPESKKEEEKPILPLPPPPRKV